MYGKELMPRKNVVFEFPDTLMNAIMGYLAYNGVLLDAIIPLLRAISKK